MDAPLSPAARAVLDRFGPEVETTTSDGVVILSGMVADDKTRRLIEQELLALPEVMDVRNHLTVASRPGEAAVRYMAGLAQEGVDVTGLQAKVEGGVVTLTGRAATWFDRDVMERRAWSLGGVRKVENRLALPPGAVEPDRDAAGDLIA